MNQQTTITPTLFKLLAREWSTGAAIKSMLFNGSQTAVAYALDNGTVAIAEVSDEDPPEQRVHINAEDGRSIIRPRSIEPKSLQLIEVEDSGQMLFGCIGETDFIACGPDGQVLRISPNGEVSPLGVELHGPVSALGHCPTSGQFAFVSGTQISVFDDKTVTLAHRLDHGEPIAAAGFSPNGQSIAIAHDYGVTIWSLDAERQKTKDVAFAGRPCAVHWSPDGNWIACPLSDGGFQLSSLQDMRTRAVTDYPAPVQSVAWNKKANALITSGAFRVAAWSMNAPPIDDTSSGALETGRAGLVPVSAVSSHPDRNLVVAGYENGFITIVQIAGRDELVLNSEDHGAVTNLVWSHNGRHIALGTDRELAAIITLPPQMFK